MSLRILVVGASGFIGAAATRYMAGLGHDVLGVGRRRMPAGQERYDARSLDAADLRALIGEFRPDVCVNAAGAGYVAASLSDPNADYEINVALTQRILDALRMNAPTSRYLGFSSAAVYGENPALPWREDAVPRPVSPYGYHKRLSELLVEQYYRMFGLQGLSVRLFSAYGPGLRRQLFWDLFHRSRGSTELTLFSTGRETRHFIYVDDVVTALMALLDRAAFEGETLNLAAGQPTTTADACAIFLHILRWSGGYEFAGIDVPGSITRMEADMTTTHALGVVPATGLDDGLRRTAAWLTSEHKVR